MLCVILYTGRGRGVPNRLMAGNNHAKPISDSSIVDPDAAVRHFESLGGHITTFSPFGEDPLKDRSHLVAQRETEFHARYPNFNNFFHALVNSNYILFHEGILFFIEISKRLLESV